MRHLHIRALTVVVTVGFAASAYIAAREQGRGVQDAAQQHGRQTNPARSPAGSVADKGPSSKVYDPDCRKPKDHEEADLCVQREAVKASEKAAWWAAFQSYIAVTGLAGVIGSLILASWAANESRKSAKAARRSADLAAVALATSNRPWIKVESIAISAITFYPRDDDSVSVGTVVQITIKNIGDAVALNVGYEFWMLAAPLSHRRGESIAEIHQAKCEENSHILNNFVLWPNEVHREFTEPGSGKVIGVDSETLAKAIRNRPDRREASLIIGGIVTYNIAADEAVHRTTFHFALGYRDDYTDIPISPAQIPPENIRIVDGHNHGGLGLRRIVD